MRLLLHRPLLGLILCTGLAGAQQPSDTPASIRVPDSQPLLFKAHGAGTQIYTCKSTNSGPVWTLKGPDAQLVDTQGKPIGKHFAGPTWKANDGKPVLGKVAANAQSPNPTAIPWLLLSAVSHDGDGVMTKVGSIQRLNTAGGKSPAAGCDASHIGAETSVHYTADYYFYSGPPQ